MKRRILAAALLALLAPAAGAEVKFAAADAMLIEHRLLDRRACLEGLGIAAASRTLVAFGSHLVR